jgi:hypothetical protein
LHATAGSILGAHRIGAGQVFTEVTVINGGGGSDGGGGGSSTGSAASGAYAVGQGVNCNELLVMDMATLGLKRKLIGHLFPVRLVQ